MSKARQNLKRRIASLEMRVRETADHAEGHRLLDERGRLAERRGLKVSPPPVSAPSEGNEP
jgi:hypothetical protein